MKKSIQKTKSKKLYKVIVLIKIALFLYIIDWSFIRGSIKEYSLYCPDNYDCMTAGVYRYYPNKKKQEVISKSNYSIKTLKKCTVINRTNWECKHDDESAVFGFNNGKFNERTLWSSPGIKDSAIMNDLNYISVSRFQYLLYSWGLK